MALRVSAVRGHDLEFVVAIDVAGRAGDVRVPVRQGKARCVVIEPCAQPTVKGVARFAGGRKLCGDVIRIRRLLKILQVARSTSRGKPLELPNRGALVAVIALHRRVGAEKREAILVILHLLYSNVPALHGMTLRAIRAHPPLVNVGMAVLAVLSHRGKDRFDVALRARHLLMHAAKRILGFVVVEFRYRADGAPTRRVVTVFTWNRKRSMRTSRVTTLARR